MSGPNLPRPPLSEIRQRRVMNRHFGRTAFDFPPGFAEPRRQVGILAGDRAYVAGVMATQNRLVGIDVLNVSIV